jgi:hypothetical protein
MGFAQGRRGLALDVVVIGAAVQLIEDGDAGAVAKHASPSIVADAAPSPWRVNP